VLAGVMTVGSSVVSHPAARRSQPLLGLRLRPGRLALIVFRLPLLMYRQGWGWLLGDTFLLLAHAGRKTGRRYSTVVMVLRYNSRTHEAIICSAWGQDADWIRNIRAHPALQVQIGRHSFTPRQRFLSEDESVAVVTEFRRRHPHRSRLLASVLGCGDLGSDPAARGFVSTRPFVSLRPLGSGHGLAGGEGHD